MDQFVGWNTSTVPESTQPPILSPNPNQQYQGWLSNGVTQRDCLAGFFQTIDTSFTRTLILYQQTTEGPVETEILPRPYISRVGSKARPYRLLSGQEIQLSEDDIRVYGISKRYALSDIWQWGVLYILDPIRDTSGRVDLGGSTVCELVFIDDSNPLTWTLNLRKRSDSRVSATEYDLP